eukprot:8238472-Lingulodinium_polyedra.AAC.1
MHARCMPCGVNEAVHAIYTDGGCGKAENAQQLPRAGLRQCLQHVKRNLTKRFGADLGRALANW